MLSDVEDLESAKEEDTKEGTIRLDPGETKNGEGRTYYMNEK